MKLIKENARKNTLYNKLKTTYKFFFKKPIEEKEISLLNTTNKRNILPPHHFSCFICLDTVIKDGVGSIKKVVVG